MAAKNTICLVDRLYLLEIYSFPTPFWKSCGGANVTSGEENQVPTAIS